MKPLSLILIVLLAGCATASIQPPAPAPCPVILSVCFSPKGGCTDTIVQELDKAKGSILVQAYSFTSAPIAKALVAAPDRGSRVEIILAKSNLTAQYTSGPYVAKAGIPVKTDSAHDIAHNKIMIIDGEIVITGSFNFTKNAEDNNPENLLIIRDKDLAAKYIENWKIHWEHSEVYAGSGR